MSVEKSRTTLWAAVVSTACIITEYIVYRYRLSFFVTDDFATALGTAIGALTISPHLIFFALACIFAWVGYVSDVRGLTLTGGILHAVALLFGLQNWYIVVIPLVFCFWGYAEQKQLSELADERRNNPEAYKAFMDDEAAAEKAASEAFKDVRSAGIGEKILWAVIILLAACLLAVLIGLLTGHSLIG